MQLPVLDHHLETTPEVCGGKPRITGRRITVQNVAVWHGLGQSPDEIAAAHDLPLAAVYAALAYYHDHREQMDTELAEAGAFLAELRAATPSPLAEKRGRHAA